MVRWPRKREVAALYLLYRRGPRLNLGVAVDVLRGELCVTKRTARNILKRLRRLGALRVERAGGELVVEAVDPAVFIGRIAEAYVEWRRGRCRLPPLPGSGGG